MPDPASRPHVLLEPSGSTFTADQRWPLDTLRLPAAWDITTGGSPGPLVAIVDTGVAATADLAGRIESGATYVGGAAGSDPNGHGTLVAGIVAASGSDGVGLAGSASPATMPSLQRGIPAPPARGADGSAHGIVDAAAALTAIQTATLGSGAATKAPLLRVVQRPQISGAATTGAALSATTGSWSGGLTSIVMTWQRCTTRGKTVPGRLAWQVQLSDQGSRQGKRDQGRRPRSRRGRQAGRGVEPPRARSPLSSQSSWR